MRRFPEIVFALAIAVSCDRAAAQATLPSVVRLTIDAARDVHSISPYLYGVNHDCDGAYAHLTLTRLGGNRWTCYNWTNNASNAGADYHFQNDGFLGGGNAPGGAVAGHIAAAQRDGAAIILTIPINGYVSADQSPGGDVRGGGADYLSRRFRPELPVKGAPFTLTPDAAAPAVYQDEFVNWVKNNYPAATVFYMLDNEPAIWAKTHAEVRRDQLTYQELADRSIQYARGIKSAAPDALVFGPAEYGWSGFLNLQGAADAPANGDFLGYYLRRFAAEEKSSGRRLLDVLDVHWYPEARGGGVRITEGGASPEVAAARLQAPRSLWDADYVEESWITRDGKPIDLLPRLRKLIDENYPGTRLSISEYNYGGGADISGAIAEADALGVFGRENVYAACQWPLSRREPFAAAGMAMYRNFDGKGGAFGKDSVFASTSNAVGSSVYAGVDAGRLVIVAINKLAAAQEAMVTIEGAPALHSGQVYQLTGPSPASRPAGEVQMRDSGFDYLMPPMSVSTIVLE